VRDLQHTGHCQPYLIDRNAHVTSAKSGSTKVSDVARELSTKYKFRFAKTNLIVPHLKVPYLSIGSNTYPMIAGDISEMPLWTSVSIFLAAVCLLPVPPEQS
jgi:hypothetical protein